MTHQKIKVGNYTLYVNSELADEAQRHLDKIDGSREFSSDNVMFSRAIRLASFVTRGNQLWKCRYPIEDVIDAYLKTVEETAKTIPK